MGGRWSLDHLFDGDDGVIGAASETLADRATPEVDAFPTDGDFHAQPHLLRLGAELVEDAGLWPKGVDGAVTGLPRLLELLPPFAGGVGRLSAHRPGKVSLHGLAVYHPVW